MVETLYSTLQAFGVYGAKMLEGGMILIRMVVVSASCHDTMFYNSNVIVHCTRHRKQYPSQPALL
jgi:hypothetical protein